MRFGERRFGDWRDGEPLKLELNEVAVCMLADDVPDLTGILAPSVWVRKWVQKSAKGGW